MVMRLPALKGFCFGLTSGIITTLGMIVGLDSSTHSKLVVLGGIVSIAVADSFSDALGMHISEESDKKTDGNHVWIATVATFLSKLVFSSTFIIPVLLFDLPAAIKISIVWGILVLGLLSYYIAVDKKEKPVKVLAEHLSIAVLVIIFTHLLGHMVARVFG